MLLIVMLIGLVTALLVYGMVDTSSLVLRRDQDTAAALAQVKQALIGWSAARTPPDTTSNIRPGELPCPDIDNTGTDAGGCAAGAIGRVPWKSLGIPEPKDSAGETLWYAIAGPFRNSSMSTVPITSDTLGTLTVYHDSSATTLTSQAIAVVFAPGAVLGAQNRDTAITALCPTTGTSIALNLCAANYLETAAGVNNSTTNGPFISAPSSNTFNDKVIVITTADLMPVVEQRVARELLAILKNYKTATAAQGENGGAGYYPWADNDGDGRSDDGINRGRFPCDRARPRDWNEGGPPTPTLPKWLTNGCTATPRGWASVIYYTAAQNRLPAGCTTCAGTSLSVIGAPPGDTDLVLLTPGAASASPRGAWPTAYFEDSLNTDADDSYVTPTSTAYNRDRIYTIP